MRRNVARAALAAALGVALFAVGGLGLFRGGGTEHPAGTAGAARPAARAIPPVILTGSVAQEIASLQARVRALPADWHSDAALGIAYVQQARLTADPSYYPRAEGVLRRSLALDTKDNFDAMTGMASLAAARHEFTDALSWGQRGIAINPYNANIHAITGDALLELGRYQEAFNEFQRALDLKPNLTTYARGSYAQELQGDIPDAIRTMKMAVESAGNADDLAWASTQLGDLSFNTGDLAGASLQYRRAMGVSPTFVQAHAGMAKVAAAHGDFATAIAGYSWVVQRSPLPDYVVALGDAYQVSGQPDQASRQYGLLHLEERLFRANGVNMDLEIALFDADHGTDLQAGLAAAQREWGRRQSIVVADALAWELYANGRYAEALGYSNRALALGTQSALFRFHRGMIERALGRDDAARRDLAEALGINPHFSVLWSGTAARTLAELRGASK
jgi:tetratricopeptide (TPR) repeat protein